MSLESKICFLFKINDVLNCVTERADELSTSDFEHEHCDHYTKSSSKQYFLETVLVGLSVDTMLSLILSCCQTPTTNLTTCTGAKKYMLSVCRP